MNNSMLNAYIGLVDINVYEAKYKRQQIGQNTLETINIKLASQVI